MIFQSICHPHFLPSSAGSGTDVTADTGGLLSPRACVCVCVYVVVCLCMQAAYNTCFCHMRERSGGREGTHTFCFFLISVCGRSLYSRGVGPRAACLCACVRKCVVLNLSRQTVTICCLETPADITHQTL